jgi:Peptidase family M28
MKDGVCGSAMVTACLALSLLAACSTSSRPAGDAGTGHPIDEDTSDAGESAGCGASVASMVACVDQERLERDVTFIAAPRLPKSPHWQAVQDLCAERFAQYGFEVELHAYATGVNVIGKRLGSERPDEQLVISAHYDHIANCSGADDNATGVAAVLEMARVVWDANLSRTLILACWDEEERGLLGALAYAARAKERGDQIIAMTAFDMIGYKNDAPDSQKIPAGFELLFAPQYQAVADNAFRADFVSLVAIDSVAPLAEAFVARARADGPPTSLITLTPEMAQSPLLSDLTRSDHAAFWLQGFPALLVTDSSNFRYAQYHCRGGDDVPSLLSFDFMTRITRASVAAHLDILGLK